MTNPRVVRVLDLYKYISFNKWVRSMVINFNPMASYVRLLLISIVQHLRVQRNYYVYDNIVLTCIL